jgi:hypothetical protein
MPQHFRDALIPRLHAAFPAADMQFDVKTGSGPALVVFPAKHPEVGELVIYDWDDQYVVFIGNFTHLHFGDWDTDWPAAERARSAAGEVVEYLRKVFADEVVFYGNHRGGGDRPRSSKERGFLSKAVFGERSYVWSGPLEPKDG